MATYDEDNENEYCIKFLDHDGETNYVYICAEDEQEARKLAYKIYYADIDDIIDIYSYDD